ncbi:MAG: hypothetical protein KC416_05040 [Myxococcales bacterium]|nr:hypothetical protein [Myxococcales bacterium]
MMIHLFHNLKRGRHLAMPAVAALALLGCAADRADDIGSAYQKLTFLPEVSWESVSGAPAGCEGLLHGDEDFARTYPFELVAALRDGAAVCVDTRASLSWELQTLSNLDPDEPNPQPNRQFEAPDLGEASATQPDEPNPQPNKPQPSVSAVDPDEPNPQPN